MAELETQTIYGMTLAEFTDYLVGVMGRVFNPRFDAIEADIAVIKRDIEDIKDALHLNQFRFGVFGQNLVQHDRKIEELAK